MSNYNFPNSLTSGSLAWLSEYNGSMQVISDRCFCIWTGVPLWTVYKGPQLAVLLEPSTSTPFGKSPTLSESEAFDTLDRQMFGVTKDRGRKQYGNEASPSAPDRLDTDIADILRVGFGGYIKWDHSETAGTPAYFDKATGVLSAVTGTLHVGVFMPDNEIMLYPNRE